MSKSPKKKGLGKGLSALLADDRPNFDGPQAAQTPAVDVASLEGRRVLPIAYLERNPGQPRTHFDEEALADLTASLKERGLLQPILVRPVGEDRYQIVAGERRWRAAQKAGLHEVPVVVRELEDDDTLQIAIVENVQREDLSPIEEGRGYRRLVDEFHHSAESVAELVNKSRSHVANLMRLLVLPAPVQKMVEDGEISMGHARALIGAEDPTALARKIMEEGLSVRQTEALAGAAKGKVRREPRPGGTGSRKDADTLALERDLAAAIGAKVSIEHQSDGSGKLILSYDDLDALDALCAKLGVCGID